MARLSSILGALGNAGAVANARQVCEERRRSEARVDALVRRVAARSVRRANAA